MPRCFISPLQLLCIFSPGATTLVMALELQSRILKPGIVDARRASKLSQQRASHRPACTVIRPQSLGQHGAAAQAAGGGAAALRPLAVSLLCGMAHSTERTRAELWANSGLDILVNLLKEPARSRA